MPPQRLKRIVITAGDPCGIGPEVILKALRRAAQPKNVQAIVIGERAVFRALAARLGLSEPAWAMTRSVQAAASCQAKRVLLDCRRPGRFRVGHSSRAAGAASLAYLDAALALWKAGALDALVTAPVTKWAVAQARPGFIGHTEYLAGALRAPDVVMMFASEQLRVALLTRHLPLRRVPAAVTSVRLERTARITARALSDWFGIRRPRLALCALNPHAGEGERTGEEARRFVPALRRLRASGVRCEGPFAADGFFAAHVAAGSRAAYDAILCPYHDQGLIPFKMLARDRGCQVSLGLPFVRTSPDHGSALDIAGKGVADPGSMAYALALAMRLC